MRHGFFVSLACLVLFSSGRMSSGGSDEAEAVVKKICSRIYTEGPSDQDIENEIRDLTVLGDAGRKALRRLARSKEPAGGRACSFLVRMNDELALPIARELLNDRKSTRDQQRGALWMVAEYKDLGSLDRVLTLFRSGDKDVAEEAGRTLSTLGNPRGLAALRQALEAPGKTRGRGWLVEAVGVPGHEQAVDLLIRLLDDPIYQSDEYSRGKLMQSLARIGTVKSRARALAIARTIDHTDTLGHRMLYDLWLILGRPAQSSASPEETGELDVMIRELEGRLGIARVK